MSLTFCGLRKNCIRMPVENFDRSAMCLKNSQWNYRLNEKKSNLGEKKNTFSKFLKNVKIWPKFMELSET